MPLGGPDSAGAAEPTEGGHGAVVRVKPATDVSDAGPKPWDRSTDQPGRPSHSSSDHSDRESYPRHHATLSRRPIDEDVTGRILGNEHSAGGRPRSRSAARDPSEYAHSKSLPIACSSEDRPGASATTTSQDHHRGAAP